MGRKKYHYPAVTVDVLLIAYDDSRLKVLLIQRKNPPFKGYWAFPGGFIEIDERLVESAVREMAEETSIKLSTDELIQFYTAGDPGRDPRGRTISVCYLAFRRFEKVKALAKAADDARSLQWFDLYSPPTLAFDHAEILQQAIRSVRQLFTLNPALITRKLLSLGFTLQELTKLTSQIFWILKFHSLKYSKRTISQQKVFLIKLSLKPI